MKILKLYILLILLFPLNSGYAQDVPFSQKLIDDGYDYLEGWIYQGTPEDAKKSFNKAKRLFFYKKSVVNDAKLGLSEYYLVVNDTLMSIKILSSIIGNITCKKIENLEFSKLKETAKDDWNKYYSTRLRIRIALSQKEFNLAKNYLEYLKGFVNVTWYCGIGSWGHTQFVEEVELRLKENGY